MKLIWYKRRDDLWNAECACGATLCGSSESEREEFETWHFARADEYRRNGNKVLLCGSKEPIPDPNEYNVEYQRQLDAIYAKTRARFADALETLEKSRQELLEIAKPVC
jgi:hypothetical protein